MGGVNRGAESHNEAQEAELINEQKSTNRKAKITASVGGNQTKRAGQREGASHEEKASVMIHFEDAAFDDDHVSIPHNLMFECVECVCRVAVLSEVEFHVRSCPSV